MLQTEVDLLKNIRTLPKSILKNIGELIVNRIGNDKNAFMITENIYGFIACLFTLIMIYWDKIVR